MADVSGMLRKLGFGGSSPSMKLAPEWQVSMAPDGGMPETDPVSDRGPFKDKFGRTIGEVIPNTGLTETQIGGTYNAADRLKSPIPDTAEEATAVLSRSQSGMSEARGPVVGMAGPVATSRAMDNPPESSRGGFSAPKLRDSFYDSLRSRISGKKKREEGVY